MVFWCKTRSPCLGPLVGDPNTLDSARLPPERGKWFSQLFCNDSLFYLRPPLPFIHVEWLWLWTEHHCDCQ